MDDKTTNDRCCPICGEPYVGHVQIASGKTVPSYRCGQFATKAETPVCDRIVRIESEVARLTRERDADAAIVAAAVKAESGTTQQDHCRNCSWWSDLRVSRCATCSSIDAKRNLESNGEGADDE